MFKKYQHIERYGTGGCYGIEKGKCYIFHKLDGTNGQLWFERGKIFAGSRNRELTIDEDNAGFYKAILQDSRFANFFNKYPNYRLYGEWLVPHTVKTYEEKAWREFYIFDVCIDKGETVTYLPYENYVELLQEFDLSYIPPIAVIDNPSYEQLIGLLSKTTFLVKDGLGEGIVIKNYDFVNSHSQTIWAKIITSEFHAKKKFNSENPQSQLSVEEKIINDFVTEHFIEKTYQKIINSCGEWNNKLIPQLINRVFNELITEEIWNILKDLKMPIINFKELQKLTTSKIKLIKSDLF